MTITTFVVPDISCATCKDAIEKAVAPAEGVARVEVDVSAKTVTVRYDAPVTVERLIELIEDQGYDIAGRTQGGGAEVRSSD